MSAPAWLTARPIAHRGLHDAARGLAENSIGAAEAAIAGGFAIECDVQLSRDGEAMVFHDDNLRRLTRARGALADRSVAELQTLALRDGGERIPTLPQFLARIGSRTPLICELKSAFDGDMRLAERVAEIAGPYAGPLALKSFDPAVIGISVEPLINDPLVAVPTNLQSTVQVDGNKIIVTITGWTS